MYRGLLIMQSSRSRSGPPLVCSLYYDNMIVYLQNGVGLSVKWSGLMFWIFGYAYAIIFIKDIVLASLYKIKKIKIKNIIYPIIISYHIVKYILDKSIFMFLIFILKPNPIPYYEPKLCKQHGGRRCRNPLLTPCILYFC